MLRIIKVLYCLQYQTSHRNDGNYLISNGLGIVVYVLIIQGLDQQVKDLDNVPALMCSSPYLACFTQVSDKLI